MSVTINERRIKAVVFDFDGLMFNTEEVFHRAGCELLSRRDCLMTAELQCQMMGRRPAEAFAVLIATHRLTESIEDLIVESREIFFELLPLHLAAMPGLYELLEWIEKRALPMAVATSSPRYYLEDLLTRFDLLRRFPTTLTAEDVIHGKPHPEIYLKAAERLSVQPGEMLVLEDSEAGTRAAVAAGAVAVSIPHEHSRLHDFRGAALIADRLDDPRILQMLEARPSPPA